MPEGVTSTGALEALLLELESRPEILGAEYRRPVLRVLHAATEKRFTDFFRLEVRERGAGGTRSQRFWLRRVKNKPREEALAALRRQHDLLAEACARLQGCGGEPPWFSCSEPVALLEEHQTLITRECRGELLNRYLCRQVPPLAAGRLDETFRRVGTWLKAFHRLFAGGALVPAGAGASRGGEGGPGGAGAPGSELLTLCHGDFSPRNIFVSRDSVEVIDFVAAGPGPASRDVEFFCCYLTRARLNGLYSQRLKNRLLAAFTRAYDRYELHGREPG